MPFVEDSPTRSWGERSICSTAYFFNGLLDSEPGTLVVKLLLSFEVCILSLEEIRTTKITKTTKVDAHLPGFEPIPSVSVQVKSDEAGCAASNALLRGLRDLRGKFISLPLVAVALIAVIVGCRGEPDTPEAQIRALVAQAQSAAEKKDIATLRGMISERYADAMENDKRTLTAIVAHHFLRNRSIYLFAKVGRIDLPEVARAEAVVYLAMAARPIPTLDALGGLRADIYRFDLDLAEESPRDWKLRSAQWRPAELEDLK